MTAPRTKLQRKLEKQKLTRLWCLKPSTKLCNDFYVWDSETGHKQKNGRVHWALDGKFIFGVIYGHNYTKICYSKRELIETLKDSRFKNKILFAHNAEFDINAVWDNVFYLDPNAIFKGSRFMRATNGNCTFADSGNIFIGRSVKQIGKMLKIEKKTLGNESYITDWNNEDERALAINYCIRDCEVIYEALVRSFEFAGDIKISQASLSLTYFRRHAQPFHIDANENVRYFWLSYFGGRTEAFKKGKTHAKVIDVNSMYPKAMHDCIFPNPKNLKVLHNVSEQKFKKILLHFEGCCHVSISHTDFKYGVLPYKDQGKLLFPTGDFTGWWNFNEFRYALELGVITIRKVHKVVYAEPMESPFKNFVIELNRLKILAEAEGNEFERDRAKRYSNSLYGKFGERIEEETIYIQDIEKQFDLIREYQQKNQFIRLVTFNSKRKDAYLVFKSGRISNVSHAIPSFSSYVTSWARIQLLKQLLLMDKNKPVYCDTDSIAYEIDDGSIISSRELGGWKVEDKIITWIGGLKNYRYIDLAKGEGEKWRVKGVPERTGKKTKIFVGEESTEVETVLQTGENTFEYYNLIKSKEALKRGLKARTIQQRKKMIKDVYDKRVVKDNGETEPIKIKNI